LFVFPDYFEKYWKFIILTFLKYKQDPVCYQKPLSKSKIEVFFQLLIFYTYTEKIHIIVKLIHSLLSSESKMFRFKYMYHLFLST